MASKVVNEPRIKNPLIKAIRELLEHRALWLYLLTDEAAKAGADPAAFAPAAVKRCGLFQGAELVAKGGGTNSRKSLKKGLFGKPAQMVFEMDVKDVQDDRFELEFHYCPLVKAWQKQGCTDEEISNLCDWAMCGDRGIGARPPQDHRPRRRRLPPHLPSLKRAVKSVVARERVTVCGRQALFFLIGRTPG